MKLGRVIRSEVAKNRDGEGNVLLLTVEIAEPGDEQTVELFRPAGIDARPAADVSVLVADLGQSWPIALAVDDELEPEAEEGEAELYSYAAGAKLARVKCNADSEVVINAGEDWAVQFSALKAAFEELQGKWNTFAAAYVPGGPAVQGTPPTAGESTGDIDSAKIANVRLP